MRLTILGNNSALPQHGRFPTAQVLQLHNEWILIDCGEGTQIRFQRNNIKASKISKIFISHLHGDHYFGLIGLLTSYSLNNRSEPLDLYGPEPLIKIINLQLEVANTSLTYPLNFHPIHFEEPTILIDNLDMKVTTFRTDHRIECYGFRFEELHYKKKLNVDVVESYEVPFNYYKNIVSGEDYITIDGKLIPNHELTFPPNSNSVYSYCADTRYTELFLDVIANSDYLYYETTYLKEHQELAIARYHSTTADAVRIASKSNAKNLIIGHFSSKYKELNQFIDECRDSFLNTFLAEEGISFEM